MLCKYDKKREYKNISYVAGKIYLCGDNKFKYMFYQNARLMGQSIVDRLFNIEECAQRIKGK